MACFPGPIGGVSEGVCLCGVPTPAGPQTTRKQTGRERPAATVAGYRNHQGIPCACRLFRPSLPLCLRGLPCYSKSSRIRHDRACLHRGAAPIMRARVTPASVNICWGGATGGALPDPIFRCDERTSGPVGSKARLAGLVLPTGSLKRDLPAKSSQYSTLWPTTLKVWRDAWTPVQFGYPGPPVSNRTMSTPACEEIRWLHCWKSRI